MNKQKNFPKVSVIVAAKNEERHIARCLDSIANQQLNYDFETIVVDNYSTDDTYSIANSRNINVVQTSANSPAAVRNFGASHAKGKFFAFIDGDCEASNYWLKYCIEILESNNSIAACGGPCLPPPNANWVIKSWAPLIKTNKNQIVRALPGANIVVNSEYFKKIKGFNEALITAEDDDFCRRLRKEGYKIWSSDQAVVHHYGYPDSVYDVFKKSVWHGTSQIQAHGLHKDKVVILTVAWLVILLVILFFIVFSNSLSVLLFLILCLLTIPAPLTLKRLGKTTLKYRLKYIIPSYFICSVSMSGRAIGLLLEVKRYFMKQSYTF